MTQKSNIKRSLIRKLLSRRVIGNHHIRLETLMRCGWKPHEKGLVKKAIDDLIKQGLIVWVKKSKKSLTLNKERMKEIKLQYTEGF